MAAPALLLVAGQLAIATQLPEMLMYQVAMALPFVAWLLIGFLQFRLLRWHLRRPRLWIVATLAGGVVGNAASGFVFLGLRTAMDNSIVDGEAVSAWADIFAYAPPVLMAAASAAILGLAQIACFDDTRGEHFPWFCASLVAGILGGGLGALVSHYALQGMITARFFDFLSTPILLGLVPVLIAAVVNMILYGVLTGLCMRWLLIRRAGLQRATLVGQFE